MRYSNLDSLSMDVRSASLDELVLAHLEVSQTIAAYQGLGLDVPERLAGLVKDIKREVDERVRADKERKLKAMRARREALKTPDEKRSGLDAQIAELEKQLA